MKFNLPLTMVVAGLILPTLVYAEEKPSPDFPEVSLTPPEGWHQASPQIEEAFEQQLSALVFTGIARRKLEKLELETRGDNREAEEIVLPGEDQQLVKMLAVYTQDQIGLAGPQRPLVKIYLEKNWRDPGSGYLFQKETGLSAENRLSRAVEETGGRDYEIFITENKHNPQERQIYYALKIRDELFAVVRMEYESGQDEKACRQIAEDVARSLKVAEG